MHSHKDNIGNRSRTLIVSAHALTFHDGGIPAYTARLIEALESIPEIDSTVIYVDGQQLPAMGSAISRVPVARRLPNARPLLSHITTVAAMGFAAHRLDPNALLLSPSDFWSPARKNRSAVVTHDALPELDRVHAGSFVRRAYRHICLRYAMRSTAWLSISEFAAQEIRKTLQVIQGPEVLANWLPKAYSLTQMPADVERVRMRYKIYGPFFLYVGGYRGYKNVQHLVASYFRAQGLKTLPPLVLAGRLPDINSLKYFSEDQKAMLVQGLANGSILNTGFVDDLDMPALYKAASGFVSPSLHEGFGYPAVEAMAVGCPVLVADRTAFREVVPKADCRFDPDSIEELSEKLVMLANDPDAFLCDGWKPYTFEQGVARLRAFLQRQLRALS